MKHFRQNSGHSIYSNVALVLNPQSFSVLLFFGAEIEDKAPNENRWVSEEIF